MEEEEEERGSGLVRWPSHVAFLLGGEVDSVSCNRNCDGLFTVGGARLVTVTNRRRPGFAAEPGIGTSAKLGRRDACDV